MATNRDYYEILGINKTASADEIKKAYRAMALKFHPDRNKEKDASEKFKEINQAYEVLSNSDKRATYDQFGHAAFEQGNMGQGSPYGPGGASSYQNGPFTYTYSNFGQEQGTPFDFGGFSDPFDIFEQFFGGSTRQTRRQSRKTYSLSISFMEAVKGIEKEVDINGKQTVIKIPAGVDSNSRIRFNDFDIVLEVSEDKVFKREDQNIFVDLPLSISQAVLGTVVSVPTIDGPVSLKIQSGTQHGSLIRLKGRGVASPRGGSRGDEYVKIKIIIPTKLSREQKTLFEQLEKSALR